MRCSNGPRLPKVFPLSATWRLNSCVTRGPVREHLVTLLGKGKVSKGIPNMHMCQLPSQAKLLDWGRKNNGSSEIAFGIEMKVEK